MTLQTTGQRPTLCVLKYVLLLMFLYHSPTPTQSMLIMTSIIRVGQSKFVTVPIDEDSNERILNCIQTLSELQEKSIVHDIFLKDTKAAYSKMLVAQEVRD
jgi:vesicle coat complex subunit